MSANSPWLNRCADGCARAGPASEWITRAAARLPAQGTAGAIGWWLARRPAVATCGPRTIADKLGQSGATQGTTTDVGERANGNASEQRPVLADWFIRAVTPLLDNHGVGRREWVEPRCSAPESWRSQAPIVQTRSVAVVRCPEPVGHHTFGCTRACWSSGHRVQARVRVDARRLVGDIERRDLQVLRDRPARRKRRGLRPIAG